MIFDKIANAGLYKGMHPNMDKAIDFMMTADLHALPLGRTVIDGDRVFINKMEATTAPARRPLRPVTGTFSSAPIFPKRRMWASPTVPLLPPAPLETAPSPSAWPANPISPASPPVRTLPF